MEENPIFKQRPATLEQLKLREGLVQPPPVSPASEEEETEEEEESEGTPKTLADVCELFPCFLYHCSYPQEMEALGVPLAFGSTHH